MAIHFDSVERKQGDLYIVQAENGTLFVGNAVEKIGNDLYRVYFSFKEGMIFDSSVECSASEIKQVVRKGIAIWFNRM